MFLSLMQVGQGLSRDAKALKLAFQHWIEAVSTKMSYTSTTFFNLILAVVLYLLLFYALQMCV